jgi:hypothetical protein
LTPSSSSSAPLALSVDGAGFTGRSLSNLVKMVAKQEQLLSHTLKVRPAREARYCKPVRADFLAAVESMKAPTLDSLKAAWYKGQDERPSRYNATRYHALNLNSFFYRGTVEFRYFNGSLHAGVVKAFIQLTLALCAKAQKSKQTSGKRRVFTAETAKYDFRVVMLGLGLIGDEYKTCRFHMLDGLAGSSTFKHGKNGPRCSVRRPRVAPPVAAEVG